MHGNHLAYFPLLTRYTVMTVILMISSSRGSGRGDAEMTKDSDGGHRVLHGWVAVLHTHLGH